MPALSGIHAVIINAIACAPPGVGTLLRVVEKQSAAIIKILRFERVTVRIKRVKIHRCRNNTCVVVGYRNCSCVSLVDD